MRRLFCVALVLMFAAVFCAAQVPVSNHVVLVMEENQSYSSVIGNANWPYLNSLANQYGVATQSYGNTHPSIGNYFMLTTGQILTNNDNQTPASFPVSADNIVRQMITAGKTWKSYAEDVPSVGYTGGNIGNYLVRHNPFPYFTDVQNSSAQKLNLVPFPQFAADLANNQLPNLTYIVPNQMDDAHSGSPAQADAWLKKNLPALLASPAFQPGGDGLLIITFDESVDTDTAHGGGHIATVLIGPKVKSGYKSTTLYQQQSVGKTIMKALGLTSFPGTIAAAPDMAEFFGTSAPASTASSTSTSASATGIVVSSPANGATVTSPVNFVASASSSYPITAMRIYVDGNSMYTVNVASVNTSLSLAAGAHNVTVVAWDSSGASYTKSLSITVGSSATSTTSTSTSGSTGVTVTAPANGATVGSPTQFTASATSNSSSRPITAMRIYVDGNSMYTVNAASLNTSLSLAAGSHNVTVVAWDSSGTSYTKSLSITVGSSTTSTTSTSTSGSTGVTVTAPANGATVSSPTQFTASAISNSSSRPITAMRIYVDGNSMYTVNAASCNTSLSLAAGSHAVVVVAWDSSGASYTKSLSITVGGGTTSTGTTNTTSTGTTTTSSGSFDAYPSNALVNSHMENATWDPCNCGGTGSSTAAESLTKDGTSATVSVTGSSSGISGWLWYSPFASTNASNWIMDYNVTPTNLSGAVALEFDGNQTGSLGNFVFGTECNYSYNPSQKTVWRFWTMSGGSETWGTTSYACPITQTNHTYHVQMHFVATSGKYQVARVKVTDLTAGAVVQDQTNLGTFSAVGSHGSSIDIQLDAKAGSTMAVKYQNVSIIRW